MPSAAAWTDPVFLEEATAWIQTQLTSLRIGITDEISQDHVQPWSTVLRIPTDRGPVYFKANEDSLRHEAVIVEFLGRRRPDFVPRPLAVDADRGWMLMEHAGIRLRELIAGERSMDPWLEVLRLYAGLQLDVSDAADELVALGAPDMRLTVLPARFADLLGQLGGVDAVQRALERTSAVEEMCQELAEYGIPETIQHDDLNDGQVYFLDGRPQLLDWGDACVSHPFFSLSVALEGVISWGIDDEEDSVETAPFRDAYLEPFAERLGQSMDALRVAAATAVRLGWACRVVNGHVPGDPEPTERRLQMFLDGHL